MNADNKRNVPDLDSTGSASISEAPSALVDAATQQTRDSGLIVKPPLSAVLSESAAADGVLDEAAVQALVRDPPESKTSHGAGATIVFSLVWWVTYCLNLAVFTVVVLVQPWSGTPEPQRLPVQIHLAVAAVISNVLVADIVTDWVCIWLSIIAESCCGCPPPDPAGQVPDWLLHKLHSRSTDHTGGGAIAMSQALSDHAATIVMASIDAASAQPALDSLHSGVSRPVATAQTTRRVAPEDFLTIYCLKSKYRSDIDETLAFLRTSRDMNATTNAVFCVLSGTQDATLAAGERAAVNAFNAQHAGRRRVRYVRRCRSILFKYGQYLDFIMLLNGHRKPALYVDVPSSHASGDVFEPSVDVDFFLGSDYEFLVIMDRDNVLSPAFLGYAATLMQVDPSIEIIQPEVRPFPKDFREALHGGESCYTRLMSLFQLAGNDTQRHKKRYINMAAFFGKGVIRRSAYNSKLLLYNPATGKSQEDTRIPRDLTSHDLIESCLMTTASTQQIYVYEDFPLTHVEWCQRQIRWDQGDLVIAKYIYPYTYGALANIASRLSYRRSIGVYLPRTWAQRCIIYSSTFNIRCANGKFAILALMALMAWAQVNVAAALYTLTGLLQAQMIVLPLLGLFATVPTLRWWQKLLIQAMAVYLGSVDIWFGAFRALHALVRMAVRFSKWNTFEALGMSPPACALAFMLGAALELGVAALLAAFVIWREWPLDDGVSTQGIFLLTYLSLILTFPAFVFATTFKCGTSNSNGASSPRLADTAQLPKVASREAMVPLGSMLARRRHEEFKCIINEALDELLLALKDIEAQKMSAKPRTVGDEEAGNGGVSPRAHSGTISEPVAEGLHAVDVLMM